MTLKDYFENLIQTVENSDEFSNAGKDAEGFYKPVRTILLRHLQLLKDLHQKPLAKPMLQASWKEVVKMVPPEDLLPPPEVQAELKKILE